MITWREARARRRRWLTNYKFLSNRAAENVLEETANAMPYVSQERLKRQDPPPTRRRDQAQRRVRVHPHLRQPVRVPTEAARRVEARGPQNRPRVLQRRAAAVGGLDPRGLVALGPRGRARMCLRRLEGLEEKGRAAEALAHKDVGPVGGVLGRAVRVQEREGGGQVWVEGVEGEGQAGGLAARPGGPIGLEERGRRVEEEAVGAEDANRSDPERVKVDVKKDFG